MIKAILIYVFILVALKEIALIGNESLGILIAGGFVALVVYGLSNAPSIIDGDE